MVPTVTRFTGLCAALVMSLQGCSAPTDIVTGNADVPTQFETTTGTVTIGAIGASRTITVVARDRSGRLLPGVPVTWTSSNATIAEVVGRGTSAVVTALAPGQAIIHAHTGDLQVAIEVGVRTVRKLSLAPHTLSVVIGAELPLQPTVDAEAGALLDLDWLSEQPSVAAVSAQGVMTGVAPGTTMLRVSAVGNPRVTAEARVTVTSAGTITLAPSSLSLGAGEQRLLSAMVQLEPGLSTALSWHSENPAIATVSANGTVMGVSVGSTRITAASVADTTRRSTAVVVVRPVVRDLTLNPAVATIFTGDTRQLDVRLSADPGISQAMHWRTSNAAVATVSAEGLIRGVSAGTAMITAISTADTVKQASALITVRQGTVVSVSPTTATLDIGETRTLLASVTPSSGTPESGTSAGVVWRSSNAAVAAVSVTGEVTGVAGGTATVMAISVADTTKRATAQVTVSGGLASTWSATRLGGALYEDVVSVYGFAANNAFAVNLIGDVLHWNGSTWSMVARGAQYSTQFVAVHGSSNNHVMAVGTNGVTLSFDGGHWREVRSGTTNRLNSVFMESATSGFAVGANGTALRWNGSTWSVSHTGSSQTLQSVWAIGGIAFAVGTHGEILRFADGSWSRHAAPTVETLSGVSGSSLSQVVAVGTSGTVLAYNGDVWTTVAQSSTVADLYAVSLSSATDSRYYVAGDDGLLLLSNGTLSPVATPYRPQMLSVAIDASGGVWAGGQRGSVQRRAGGRWTTLGLAPDLMDAWTTSATNAWAVGEFGVIYRWNGLAWSHQPSPTTVTLNTVWGANDTQAFAAGDEGTMLRYTGGSWSAMPFPSTASVYALWGSHASNVYAVTAAGEVVHFNGTSWRMVETVGRALWALHGTSPTDIVATGEGGVALRLTGSGWRIINANTTGTLSGVWAGSTGAMAVGATGSGNTGVAFQFNGTSWTAFSPGSSRYLTSIWGPKVTELYVTGEQGTLLRFHGTSWSTLSTGTTDLLWSVTGAADGSGGGFAVGYNGTVVAGSNSAALSSALSSALVRAPRVGRVVPRNPAAGTQAVHGPLPSGKARASRGRR